MTRREEVAVDGPVVNAGELGSSTFSPDVFLRRTRRRNQSFQPFPIPRGRLNGDTLSHAQRLARIAANMNLSLASEH